MRTALLAVALAACGGGGARPDYPSLDPAAPPPVHDIPEAPVPDLARFAPPPSAPRGEPVIITWEPPALGDTRTRTVADTSLYTTVWPQERDRRRQRTITRFAIDETITAVRDGHPTALDLVVREGEETVELDSPPRRETLLTGMYRVALEPGADRLTVTRGPAVMTSTREDEELGALYAGELARPLPLVVLLREEPLRAGETVALDEPAKRMLAGGDEPLPVPMYFHLAGVDGGVASYQLVFTSETTAEGDDPTTETRAVRVTTDVEVATGRLRRIVQTDARAELSRTSRSTTHIERTITFAY